MITPTHTFKNPKSESLKRVVETLNERNVLKNQYNNIVDPVDFAKEHFKAEPDEIININPELIEEIITLDKKQIIKYNNEVIKSE